MAGESDGTVRMYEWVDGRTGDVAIIPSTDTQVLAVASRGNRVFVAHGNHAIVVRDVATGQEIRRFATSSAPFSLALTPDGRLLAAGTYLGTVELWDIESGQKRGELKGERSVVTAIDISPGGTRLAAASRDGATRLWNVSGQSLATIAVRKPGATRVRFFPDGRRVAIGYEDGEVEIRDLEYFFRHAAGQTEYQLQLLTKAGESFPRSAEAVAWARSLLPRH